MASSSRNEVTKTEEKLTSARRKKNQKILKQNLGHPVMIIGDHLEDREGVDPGVWNGSVHDNLPQENAVRPHVRHRAERANSQTFTGKPFCRQTTLACVNRVYLLLILHSC